MKATTYDKRHEHKALLGLVILLVIALAAALLLWGEIAALHKVLGGF